MDIEAGFLDQQGIGGRVEITVIGHVIDVPIQVIIGPAGLNGQEKIKLVTAENSGFTHA